MSNLSDYDLSVIREAVDCYDLTIRTDYSGRGMNGGTCLGIIYDDLGDLLSAIVEIARQDDTLADRMARTICTDGMGYSVIAYFPSLTIANDEED